MVTGELAFERSGPDRFLTSFPLLRQALSALTEGGSGQAIHDQAERAFHDQEAAVIGRLLSHVMALRGMSTSIAGMLEQGAQPVVEAALVKDLGTAFEREVPEQLAVYCPWKRCWVMNTVCRIIGV